jgi:predicted glycosyltransferase
MRIWVDFENSPHVLILKPIIEELQRQNHQVILTARDCSQTIELAHLFGLNVKRFSHHHGRKTINKLLGHISRISRLIYFIRNKEIAVAISHGSRSQIVAAGLLKIPTFVMWDYEFASLSIIHHFIGRLVVPEAISPQAFDPIFDPSRVIQYPGIKEHIYVGELLSNHSTRLDLPFDQNKIIITMRPPAVDAHYYNHSDGSDKLFFEALKYFSRYDEVVIIVLPRTKLQQREITNFVQTNCNTKNIIFPNKAQNGLNLIWQSDIIIGGGGTMNREAAVLGVPVYSIFQGKLGAVDRYLHQSGRLETIKTAEDLKTISLKKRVRPEKPPIHNNHKLVNFIVGKILETGNNN